MYPTGTRSKSVASNGGFPKLEVPFLWGPYSQDCSILGSILVPPFGRLPNPAPRP